MDDVRTVDELEEFGRSDAVASLFRIHHRRLVGLAVLLTDDRAAAEDVVEEAFAGMCRRWWQLRDPNDAVAYLDRVVAEGGRVGRGTAERAGGLWGAWAQLPRRQRQVLAMRDYLDRSDDEIAAALAVSRGAVVRYADRGLAALGRHPVARAMDRPELERRLGDALQRRAESAMEDTNTGEQLERLLVDTRRRARRRRRTWFAGGCLAAAAVGALAAWSPGLGTRPADPSGPEQRAERTATAFVEAYADFDPDRAASHLAVDADLTIWTDRRGNDHWRRGNRWLHAVGAQVRLGHCDALWRSGTVTYVSCVFALQGLGSEELGRGPYPDNTFSLTVEGDEIVDASLELASRTNGFDREMWRPFARWVTRTHPEDAAIMYAAYPDTDRASETPRSMVLWQARVTEYVAVRAER